MFCRLVTVTGQQDMEYSSTVNSAPRPKWSEAEEATLIQAVLSRESELFGSMSGCGAEKLNHKKDRLWEEIRNELNR